LYNEKFHDLHGLPDIIIVNKSKRIKMTEHAARTGEKEMHTGFCMATLKRLTTFRPP
jgi:hypothetical protein